MNVVDEASDPSTRSGLCVLYPPSLPPIFLGVCFGNEMVDVKAKTRYASNITGPNFQEEAIGVITRKEVLTPGSRAMTRGGGG